MASSPTDVDPATFSLSISESLVVSLDATDYLQAGQSIADLTVTMTNQATGAVVSLPSPTLSGNAVLQQVVGSDLEAQQTYDLRATFTASPSTNTWTMDLEVQTYP